MRCYSVEKITLKIEEFLYKKSQQIGIFYLIEFTGKRAPKFDSIGYL